MGTVQSFLRARLVKAGRWRQEVGPQRIILSDLGELFAFCRAAEGASLDGGGADQAASEVAAPCGNLVASRLGCLVLSGRYGPRVRMSLPSQEGRGKGELPLVHHRSDESLQFLAGKQGGGALDRDLSSFQLRGMDERGLRARNRAGRLSVHMSLEGRPMPPVCCVRYRLKPLRGRTPGPWPGVRSRKTIRPFDRS